MGWKVELDMRACDSRNADAGEYLAGYNIVSDDGPEIVGCEGIIPGGDAEKHARLIAAAPAMLEALKLAFNTVGDLKNGFARSVDPSRWVEQLQAGLSTAIASAEAQP